MAETDTNDEVGRGVEELSAMLERVRLARLKKGEHIESYELVLEMGKEILRQGWTTLDVEVIEQTLTRKSKGDVAVVAVDSASDDQVAEAPNR